MKSIHKDLFDKYYFEKMSESEITQFKQQIKADPELKKAFKKYQLKAKLSLLEKPETVVDKVRKERENGSSLKESTKVMVEEKQPLNGSISTKTVTPNLAKVIPFYQKKWFKGLALAASILLVFGLGFLTQMVNYDKVYADNDIIERSKKWANAQVLNKPNGIAGSGNRDLYRAFLLFSQEDHYGSLEILNRLDESKFTPQINEFHFTKGENYRALTQFEEAINAFQKINDNSDLHNSKYMSLSLIYVKLKREQEAKQSANRILDSRDTTFQNQASKLLKEF